MSEPKKTFDNPNILAIKWPCPPPNKECCRCGSRVYHVNGIGLCEQCHWKDWKDYAAGKAAEGGGE